MVSFDVTSLFTSIPRGLVIDVLSKQLEARKKIQCQDSLRTKDLLELVELCLNTYFTFQGVTYEQTKGTPMGSPISSVIAEAVLQQLEHEAMARYRPKFWARYVDDTFVVVKRKDKTNFMEILNSIYPDIKFTVEEEDRGSIAFLDILIQRLPDQSISTKVYRKPTCTDRILHYNSNHPVPHKISCVKTLFGRIHTHCSTEEFRVEERKHLFRTFQLNGYPIGFIRRHSRIPVPQHNRHEEPQTRTVRVTLPYINNVSEATARLLAPYNIKVAHRPDQTLRAKIMRPKDPLPTPEKSGVVYKINCMDCPRSYVGETSKRLKTRIHEHKLAVRRGEQYSQVWSHMAENDHRFDFSHVQVLASDATKGGRLLKEAWYSENDSINRHMDMCPAQLALRTWHTNRSRIHREKLVPNCEQNTNPRTMEWDIPYNRINTETDAPPGTAPTHPASEQQHHERPPDGGVRGQKEGTNPYSCRKEAGESRVNSRAPRNQQITANELEGSLTAESWKIEQNACGNNYGDSPPLLPLASSASAAPHQEQSTCGGGCRGRGRWRRGREGETPTSPQRNTQKNLGIQPTIAQPKWRDPQTQPTVTNGLGGSLTVGSERMGWKACTNSCGDSPPLLADSAPETPDRVQSIGHRGGDCRRGGREEGIATHPQYATQKSSDIQLTTDHLKRGDPQTDGDGGRVDLGDTEYQGAITRARRRHLDGRTGHMKKGGSNIVNNNSLLANGEQRGRGGKDNTTPRPNMEAPNRNTMKRREGGKERRLVHKTEEAPHNPKTSTYSRKMGGSDADVAPKARCDWRGPLTRARSRMQVTDYL